MLRAGDRWQYPADCCDSGLYEVVRVGVGSAICRPLAKEHRVVRDVNGEITAEFDAPGRTFNISVQSSVIVVDHLEPAAKPRKKGL
jgi:hypothetical protein